MKIAVPASAPHLDARVEHRLGRAPYLLVIDLDDMSFEAVAGPSPSSGRGAGIQAISLVLGVGTKALLTGYISPDIARILRENGMEIITSVSGSVKEAAETYKSGGFSQSDEVGKKSTEDGPHPAVAIWRDAFGRSVKQFFSIFPVLVGVILIVGLFHGFVSRDFLLTIFPGNTIQDIISGASIGSILAGNPVNSYVIGDTLLNMGVSLFGVAALMLSWVNVGLIQVPAEMSALGVKFTVLRNMAAFIMAMLMSILTVLLTELSIP